MSVNAKLTAIADEVRELSGVTDKLGLDDMASNVGEANAEVNTQTELLTQAVLALNGKVSGGVSVQSDWNQNDSSQPDYVKNRTHWVESGDMTDIPVNGMWTNQGDGMYMLFLLAPLGLEIGKTYTVTWDGVDYAGVAHEVEYSGIPCVCLGNTALYLGTGDNGEPFVLAEFPAEAVASEGAYGFAGAADLTDGHTISIYRGAVHKLNNKFVDFQPVLNAVAKDVEEAKEEAKSESYDAMTAYVRDNTRKIEIWLTSSVNAEWMSFGKEYTKKLSLTHADKLQMRIAGARIYFSFYSSLDSVIVHPVVARDDVYITFFLNDYTIDGVDYSGKEYGVVTIKIDKDNNLTMRARRVPLTDDHINSLIDEKLGAIESGGTSITDDNEGNVTITSSGSVSITDNSEGNAVIA